MNRYFFSLSKISPQALQLMKLVGPMIIAASSNLVLSFVDMAIVGHIGVIELASVGVATTIYMIFQQILGSISVAFSITSATNFSRGSLLEVSKDCLHNFYVLLIIGVVFHFFIFYFGKVLSSSIINNPKIIDLAYDYLFYRSFSLPLQALILPAVVLFNSAQQARIGMYATLIANILNPLFSIPLTFGLLGMPQLGVSGSAIGATLSSVGAALYLVVQVIRLKIIPLSLWRFEKKIMKEIVNLATPETVNVILDYSGNLIFVTIIGLLGTVALAGSRIVFVILMFLFIIMMNFGLGTQILIGRQLGLKNFNAIEETLRFNQSFLIGFAAVLGSICFLFLNPLLSLFTNSPEVIIEARGACVVVFATLPFMALTTMYTGTLRAFGRTKWVMYSNLLPVWLIQLPVAWLAVHYHYGLLGVYSSYLFYFICRAFLGHRLTMSRLLNNAS